MARKYLSFLIANELSLFLGLFVSLMPFGALKFLPLIGMSLISLKNLLSRATQNTLNPTIEEKIFFALFLSLFIPCLLSLINSLSPKSTLVVTISIFSLALSGHYVYLKLSEGQSLALFGKFVIANLIFWSITMLLDLIAPELFMYEKYHSHQIQGIHSESFHGDRKAGALIALLSPLLLIYCTKCQKLFPLTMVPLLIFIIISGTRAYALNFILLAPLFFFVLSNTNKKRTRKNLVMTVVILLLGVLAISQSSRVQKNLNRTFNIDYVNQHINQLESNDILDKLTSYRLSMWKELVLIGAHRPVFGFGAGVNLAQIKKYADKHKIPINEDAFLHHHAHQIFIGSWIQTGLLGVVGLTIIFSILIHLLFVTLKPSNNSDDNDLNHKYVLASLLSFFILFFPLSTHYKLYGSWQLMWFFILLGMIFGYKNLNRD